MKGLKARLNFDGSSETSRYSESRKMSTREYGKRHRSRRSHSPKPSPSVFSRIRRERSRSPRQKLREKEGENSGPKWAPCLARVRGNRDLQMWNLFRGCFLVRGRPATSVLLFRAVPVRDWA
ncbi:hypothetical protein Tco_1233500 [Tanacetum coccineum]